MASRFGFRVGAPSYVFPADIVPNVVRLGPHVDDVEILLFEVDSLDDLPSDGTVDELAALARAHTLSYTVHLPLDLRLAAADEQTRAASVATARDTIEATRRLDPFAYVVHVAGDGATEDRTSDAFEGWLLRAATSLEALAEASGDPGVLAVENLTDCPPSATGALAVRVPVDLCLDVGHLLVSGDDPLAELDETGDRLRVVHLHAAVDRRDHLGLDRLDPTLLKSFLDRLGARGFRGVLTVETFADAPLFSSLDVLRTLGAR